jgi:hypothetical protein
MKGNILHLHKVASKQRTRGVMMISGNYAQTVVLDKFYIWSDLICLFPTIYYISPDARAMLSINPCTPT